MAKEHIKLIAENRKARHDYFIEDQIEAGMVLKGTEVKSLRHGRANLKDSYARIKKRRGLCPSDAHQPLSLCLLRQP